MPSPPLSSALAPLPGSPTDSTSTAASQALRVVRRRARPATSREICGAENESLRRLFRRRPRPQCNFRKRMRHDSRALFHRDDAVDRNTRKLVDLPARPSNFERIDLAAFAKPKLNARIIRRHVAHSTFNLFDVRDAFRCQLQLGANRIAI